MKINLGSKVVALTPTGIKVGSKGKVQKASEFFASNDKGTNRKVRKLLRANGRNGEAAAKAA